MFRTHPLEAVFSLIFRPQRDLEERRAVGTSTSGWATNSMTIGGSSTRTRANTSAGLSLGVGRNADRKPACPPPTISLQVMPSLPAARLIEAVLQFEQAIR
jgi:hypothetical protein